MLIAALVLTIILLAIDWRQTVYISKRPNIFSETNIILGRHPNVSVVHVYFAAWIVGIAFLHFWMPDTILYFIDAMTCAVEAYCVVGNYKLGIKI